MAYRVQISILARREARDYAAFVREERQSPDAARQWLEGLYATIRELADLPERFSVIPEAEELVFPYRSFVFHSHRVIYAVYEAEQLVIVHRIYHGARKPLTDLDID